MSNRLERVNSEIQKIVGKVLSEELEDPMVREEIVSVIGVRTSSDLSHAKVFVSILADDQKQKAIFACIKKAEGFVQKRVAEELRLRRVPEIHLQYDESMEQGERVLKILESIKGTKDESDS